MIVKFDALKRSGLRDARKEWRLLANSSSERSGMMMLVMSVMMTIRTGRCAAHSAAWLARMAATGLAQRYPPPEVACELAHFLWQWHRLIEIGQELAKHSSSCHLFCSPHHVCSIISRSHVQSIAQATPLSMERSPTASLWTRETPYPCSFSHG
jgi:hypothetical protein